MSADFTIKQGDTLPIMGGVCRDPEGAAQPLIGATVTFNMKNEAGVVVIDHAEADIIDEDEGIVEYRWQEGDTAVAGEFEFEFEVDFGGDQIQTYPNSKNKRLTIVPQIS